MKQIFYSFLFFTITVINISEITCQGNKRNCKNCLDGTSLSSSGRLYGGQAANFKQFPWQVSILDETFNFICGGSLINTLYILTAAQCFYNADPNTGQIILNLESRQVKVVTGSRYVYPIPQMAADEQASYKQRRLQSVHMHPNYRPFVPHYDIAVAKFRRNISRISDAMSPICLNSDRFATFENTEGFFSGNGEIAANSGISNLLLWAPLNILPTRFCFIINQKDLFNSDTMMCAHHSLRAPCKGDYGSPLVVLDQSSNRLTQVGILVFTNPCIREYVHCFPRFFIRVSAFLDWIVSLMPEVQTCQFP